MGITVYPAPSAASKWERTSVFTSTGSWTAPADVTSVEVMAVSGGGSGGSSVAGGGGGGGGGLVIRNLTVTPGASYTITVGAGGARTSNNEPGINGSPTSFGALLTVVGGGAGGGGTTSPNVYGKSGACGGGDAAGVQGYSFAAGGGGMGLTPNVQAVMSGQNSWFFSQSAGGSVGSSGMGCSSTGGTTTSHGVNGLNGFCGGGGGATPNGQSTIQFGKGGSGGGGRGVAENATVREAEDGFVNTGGGGGGGTTSYWSGNGGSGYMTIKYWSAL